MLGKQGFLQKVLRDTREIGKMTKNLNNARGERKNRENTKKTCHKVGTTERRKINNGTKE